MPYLSFERAQKSTTVKDDNVYNVFEEGFDKIVVFENIKKPLILFFLFQIVIFIFVRKTKQ